MGRVSPYADVGELILSLAMPDDFHINEAELEPFRFGLCGEKVIAIEVFM